MGSGGSQTTGEIARSRPRRPRPHAGGRVLTGCAVAAMLATGAGAAVAVAQGTATLKLTFPASVRAKKAFSWTVSGSDPHAAALDVFVRPTTAACAPTASKEGTSISAGGNGGQALISEQPVSAGTPFSIIRRLSPVKGVSTSCAYLHTGDATTTPDATATAKFTAKKRRGQSGG